MVVLIAVAWSIPTGWTTLHVEQWIAQDSEYLHNHIQDCSKVPEPYDFGWHHVIGPAGLQGFGDDEFMTAYTYCDNVEIPAIERATQAYRNAGVALQNVSRVCREVKKESGKPKDVPWIIDAGDGPNGERVFADVHGIRRISDAADPLYYWVGGGAGALLPAFVNMVQREVTGGGPDPTGPSMSWNILINEVDYLYWNHDFPSSDAHDFLMMDRYLTDVVTHEFMHVFGAGHPPIGPFSSNLTATLGGVSDPMAITEHLNLEVDARLYEVSGTPTAGTYKLPVLDSMFLEEHYGAQGQDWDDLRMHAWEREALVPGGLVRRYEPVGWEAPALLVDMTFKTFYGQDLYSTSCVPGIQPMTGWTLQSIKDAFPSFTSVEARNLQVEIYGMSDPNNTYNHLIPPYAPPDIQSAQFSTSGVLSIVVPAGGGWSTFGGSTRAFDLAATNIGHYGYVPTHYYADIYVVTGQVRTLAYQAVPLNVVSNVYSCVEG